MGKPSLPPRVKYFVSGLSADEGLLAQIASRLETTFGEVEYVGPSHPWNFSPSYVRELGEGIQRRFIVFRETGLQDCLPDWKIKSIEIEQDYALDQSTNQSRRINIDPGYLSASQVIMASTKRYANRVYLRNGVYADLTLYFDGDTFRPLDGLTLPDYRTRATIRFFMNLRRAYLSAQKRPDASS